MFMIKIRITVFGVGRGRISIMICADLLLTICDDYDFRFIIIGD